MKWMMRLFMTLFLGLLQECAFAAAPVTVLPENRILQFDDYVLTNNAPTPTWVHVGPMPAGLSSTRALLPGTNHFHRTGWFLRACRTGCAGYYNGLARIVPPKSPSSVPASPYIASNLAANLQNDLSALIESPVFANGIGTVYFDAINSLQAYPTQISIDVATNMFSSDLGITLYTVNPPSTNGYEYKWETLDLLNLNAATSNDFTRYSRLLNYRGSAKLRIRRLDYQSGSVADTAFTVIDNIRVSLPPSDVTLSQNDFPFEPGYPSVGTNITVRCYVSNANTNAPTDSRTVTVVYRWRYLNQVIGAWRTNAMSYVSGTGDGAGNGERDEAVLPPFADAGDLEYYFICNFSGYAYQSPDYTGLGYPYPAEALSSRTLRGSGTEFSVRLRPYRSNFGALYAETDQHSEPIAMALTGDNEWRAMVPVALPYVTNLTWRFKGAGEYVAGAEAASTGVTYWAGLSAVPVRCVPYGGTCVPTNSSGRLSVRIDSGSYAMLTLNTDRLQYMASRTEYQNFNFWPAPPALYTESNGQADKQHFLNTFNNWPTNTDEVYSEAFVGQPPAVTNVYVLNPFDTLAYWTASSAKYVSERAFDNNPYVNPNSRNLALRLKGGDGDLGLGNIYNSSFTCPQSVLPDGLKKFEFKGRLGQTSSNYDVVYRRDGFSLYNYLVRATIRAVDMGSISPETPSLSLIGYYSDPGNFYEFRITQVANPAGTPANPRDIRVSFQLYKWVNGVANLLQQASVNTDAITSPLMFVNDFAQAEMRLYNLSGLETMIQCKYGNYNNVLSYTNNAAPFRGGTYGFLSAECKASLSYVGVASTTVGDVLSGSVTTTLSTDANFDTDILSWYYPTNKYSADGTISPKGIYSVAPAQTLGVYVQSAAYGSGLGPSGTGWSLAGQVTVTNYSYQTLSVTFNSWQSHFVKLQMLGGSADVAVDDLAVYSWHGQTVPAGALSTDWKANEAWVTTNVTAEASYVQLDHSRANPAIDQAVRSLLLTNGMGVMEFDYRVLRPPAKITVQCALQLEPHTWMNVSSFVISNTVGWTHASAYLGMAQPGYFRVLNERSGACANAWVDINDVTVWDEPYVSNTAWRVYNAKITQTDTNRVLLDLTKACYLNNSTTNEAAPPQEWFAPFLASPALPKGLGTLSFYARAYNTNESATVSVYATTNRWSAPTNQWFEIARFENITNTLYQLYTFAPVGGRSDIQGVKLMTGTSASARRVCLDEVVVSEPVLPSFDIANVKLMHNDNDATYTARAQPVLGEDIAVEARVANQQLTPSNIVLYVSYYVGTNVWGVGNWPAGQTVTRRMHPVAGDPTLFRTRDDNGGVIGLPAEQVKGILKQDSDAVVQYYVWATYLGGVPLVKRQATFENPAWYYPKDLNQTFSSQGWSPYYIVYGVPLGAVWVNEINAVDYSVDGNGNPVYGIGDNKYIEIAVPAQLDLAGWSVDLVTTSGYVTDTIKIPSGLPPQVAVTNGYAFFVIGDAYQWEGVPALPKIDYGYYWFGNKIPYILPGGLRLKRPSGMYEQAIAYDWMPAYGSPFSGAAWAANDPQGKFVYVGRENNGGSLSKMSVAGDSTNTWVFPKLWTPGWPNDGQTVPSADVTMQGIQAAATPVFTPISGTTVANSLAVTITCATEGATVCYTLDGSDPSAESAVYSGVITLTQSATVKAKAFKSGLLPSFAASATFSVVFADFDIANVKVVCRDGKGTYSETRTQPLETDHVGVEARIANIQLSPSNIQMYVTYYIGTNVWGVDNWPAGQTVTKPLFPTAENPLLYRTSPTNDIPAQVPDQVVQYRVWASYLDGVQRWKYQTTFENPQWFYQADLNQAFGAWSPYYIVYGPSGGTTEGPLDIVSVKADLANTTYTASGTNIDFRITLAGRFDLNSVGGTTNMLPEIRMIVNGDVAFASLHSVMQYKVAAFTVDRTDVIFRYNVKPGDMAQPLRIYGPPTAPYLFMWNFWELRNSVTTNLAVWKFNRALSLPSEGEVCDPDLSGANITVRTLSFDENNSPQIIATEQPATWRVTTVNPVVSDAVDFYAWTTGTNIVQIGTASNQTALLVSMPIGTTDVDFPIQGLATGTADIYLQRVKDYQNNDLLGVTNYMKRSIRVLPGPRPYVRVVPSAWEYAETTTNLTGSLVVTLSESYTDDVWVLLTSTLQGASQSNIVFATTNAIRIASGSTNSTAVRFSIPDGTMESENFGIDIFPTVTNSPAKSYFTDLRPATVYVDNVRPAVTQPAARDLSLTPLPQFTNVTMGRPFTFNYTVKDVTADAASMIVRWGFGDGTAEAAMTGAVAHVTHTYASLGTKFVWMQAMDKDGGYSDESEFPITVVPPPPPPAVRILPPPGALPETNVLNGVALTVQLSEAYTNAVTVGLSISPATNDLNGAIALSTNRVVFAEGETEKTVSISAQDGTDLSNRSGFTITPTVLATPSAVAYFTTLVPGCVTIMNVAPVIVSPVDSGTHVAYTVSRAEACAFNWNVSDVGPDSSAASSTGMKVTWTFGDGASEEHHGCSGTVSHVYMAVGDMAVRVVAADKDGGSSSVQFKVRVEPRAFTFYVDASRPDDSGTGLSWGAAKKTIQAAVSATLDGDTVLVTNGVYNTGAAVAQGQTLSNRVVITQAITVRSVNGPGATVIEGSGTNCYGTAQAVRCVFMANGALQGFTLQNGATGNGLPGGGVCMFNAAVGTAVSDCVIRGNKASSGGGSYFGTLNNCTLSDNTAASSGGGACYGTLNGCLLQGNAASSGGGSCYGTLNNCTLSGNTASSGGGSYYGALNNSIVWANARPDGTVNNYESSAFYYSCSLPLPSSGVGNIAADPLFAGARNLRLRVGSPCIDAGDNVFATLPSDPLGAPRILNGKADMGAFEGGVQVAATPVLSPADGTSFSGLRKITISCATEGAEIRYTVDGTEPARQSPLYAKAFNIAQTTTVKAKAFLDGMADSSTAVSTYTRQTPLSEAVDATNLVFTTGGNALWFSQTNVTHDAQDAAQSGAVTDRQSTWMETAVTGPGALSFWWKASCEDDPDEDNWDFVRLLVDGVERCRLDGITDWRHVNCTLGAGAHVIRWEYSKDESLSGGEDRAWVDQFLVIQGIPIATITTPVPVPYAWLNRYPVLLGLTGGDYESAAWLDAAGKGSAVWQEYVAGTDPTNSTSLLLTLISVSNGTRRVAWTPDLGTARVYTVLGLTNLTGGAWGPTNAGSRFFRTRVEMPQ